MPGLALATIDASVTTPQIVAVQFDEVEGVSPGRDTMIANLIRHRRAPEGDSNSRRPMVTVIRPSRARCVKGRIPRHKRAVFTVQLAQGGQIGRFAERNVMESLPIFGRDFIPAA